MKRILWFEDQPDTWIYLKRDFEKNFELIIAEDVETLQEYLEKIKKEEEMFDLIIVDLIIYLDEEERNKLIDYFGKKVDNIAVGLEVIRKMKADGIDVPIAISTVMSNLSESGRMIFEELRRVDKNIWIISKNESPEEIIERIRKLL